MRTLILAVVLLMVPAIYAYCPGVAGCPYDGVTGLFTGYTSNVGGIVSGQYRHRTFGPGAVNHVFWAPCN